MKTFPIRFRQTGRFGEGRHVVIVGDKAYLPVPCAYGYRSHIHCDKPLWSASYVIFKIGSSEYWFAPFISRTAKPISALPECVRVEASVPRSGQNLWEEEFAALTQPAALGDTSEQLSGAGGNMPAKTEVKQPYVSPSPMFV